MDGGRESGDCSLMVMGKNLLLQCPSITFLNPGYLSDHELFSVTSDTLISYG